MPKNKFFKRHNYLSKNYFFYLLKHFILQNASPLHLETDFSNLFSVQSTKVQKIPKRLLQLLLLLFFWDISFELFF